MRILVRFIHPTDTRTDRRTGGTGSADTRKYMRKKTGKIFSDQQKALVIQGDYDDNEEKMKPRKNRMMSIFRATNDQKKPDLPLIVF